jgi:hypothetical protein
MIARLVCWWRSHHVDVQMFDGNCTRWLCLRCGRKTKNVFFC